MNVVTIFERGKRFFYNGREYNTPTRIIVNDNDLQFLIARIQGSGIRKYSVRDQQTRSEVVPNANVQTDSQSRFGVYSQSTQQTIVGDNPINDFRISDIKNLLPHYSVRFTYPIFRAQSYNILDILRANIELYYSNISVTDGTYRVNVGNDPRTGVTGHSYQYIPRLEPLADNEFSKFYKEYSIDYIYVDVNGYLRHKNVTTSYTSKIFIYNNLDIDFISAFEFPLCLLHITYQAQAMYNSGDNLWYRDDYNGEVDKGYVDIQIKDFRNIYIKLDDPVNQLSADLTEPESIGDLSDCTGVNSDHANISALGLKTKAYVDYNDGLSSDYTPLTINISYNTIKDITIYHIEIAEVLPDNEYTIRYSKDNQTTYSDPVSMTDDELYIDSHLQITFDTNHIYQATDKWIITCYPNVWGEVDLVKVYDGVPDGLSANDILLDTEQNRVYIVIDDQPFNGCKYKLFDIASGTYRICDNAANKHIYFPVLTDDIEDYEVYGYDTTIDEYIAQSQPQSSPGSYRMGYAATMFNSTYGYYIQNDIFKFNLGSDVSLTWNDTGVNTNENKYNACGVSLDDNGYIVGGVLNSSSSTTAVNTTEKYIFSTDTINTSNTISQSRFNTVNSMTDDNAYGYVIGGLFDSNQHRNTIEKVTAATDTWATIGVTLSLSQLPAASLDSNSHAYICGGKTFFDSNMYTDTATIVEKLEHATDNITVLNNAMQVGSTFTGDANTGDKSVGYIGRTSFTNTNIDSNTYYNQLFRTMHKLDYSSDLFSCVYNTNNKSIYGSGIR